MYPRLKNDIVVRTSGGVILNKTSSSKKKGVKWVGVLQSSINFSSMSCEKAPPTTDPFCCFYGSISRVVRPQRRFAPPLFNGDCDTATTAPFVYFS